MAESTEAILLEVLRRILTDLGETRRELASFRGEMQVFREEMKGRGDLVEAIVRRIRRDSAGLLASGNALVGHMDLYASNTEDELIFLAAKPGNVLALRPNEVEQPTLSAAE